MATVINSKLGEHRGKKRVWLEGQKLAREGYQPGMKFDLEPSDQKMLIKLSDQGRFTVSRRNRNGKTYPVIEVNTEELAEMFDGVEMLRIAIKSRSIVISAHHQQQRVNERVERLIRKLESGEPLRSCSLFHGGGVLDRAIHEGLKRAGFESKVGVAVEMEGKYLDSSLRNNPELWDEESTVIESPIQSVNITHNAPQVELLFGGIPCTGASRAGRTKNKLKFAESHEAAGSMFFHLLQFIQILNPVCCILENVSDYQSTSSMEVIRSVLKSLGYSLQERILDGNEFGALEKRKRLCVVAVSEGIEGFDLDNVMPVRTKESCINDILEPVPYASNRWKTFDYLAEKEKKDMAAGKGFARQLLTGEEPYCGVAGKGYCKARSTEPFLVNPLNDAYSRLFTPVEHCRIKGVPESVIDGLSDTVAHEVLGQSVIFPAFEAVASELGDSLWKWQGYKPALVEVVDDDQPCIGGDDFHWAKVLIDHEGGLRFSPVAKAVGMSLSLHPSRGEGDADLAFFDPNGPEVSSGHEPCYFVPAQVIAQGQIRTAVNMIQ